MALGIYLHIPFCMSKCSYCDFFSVIGKEEAIPAYTDAICREIEMYAERDLSVDTVFFGGGTPSYIPSEDLARIVEKLSNNFSITSDAEITCETNPETVDVSKLREFLGMGINRLSLGVQSFHDAELQQMGRAHDASRSVKCFHDAREAGFENISMDLISALPDMSVDSWQDNLQRLVDLGPDHLSAYTLEYHPGTRFERERSLGILEPAQENIERRMYLETIQFLAEHYYHHYEISNFARTGRECRHNLKYWRHEPYLAFGTAAHGFDGLTRYWNHRSLERYFADLESDTKPITESETLDESQLHLEKLMLGLRLREGTNWDGDVPTTIPENLYRRSGNTLSLTSQGFVLYDSICSMLARELC